MDARPTEEPPCAGAAPASDDPCLAPRVTLYRKPPTRALVLWSGGLDSTYALVRLLRESDDEVIAHHVHCHRREPGGGRPSRRGEYEAEAVRRLLPELRARYRRFVYHESRIDLGAFNAVGTDTAIALFFAGQAALHHRLTPFDRIVLGVSTGAPEWRPGTAACDLRRLLSVRMLKAVWESEEVPWLYVQAPRPAKQAEADYLPLDLYRLTASCRSPHAEERGAGEPAFSPCGGCAPCRARAGLVHREEGGGAHAGAGLSLEPA